MKPFHYILIAICGSGIGSFFYKFATSNLHPLVIACISLATYLTVLPIAFMLTKVEFAINLPGVLFTVISSLFLCVGTLAFSFALKEGGQVGEVTILTSLAPILTLTLSCLFLGESFSARKLIGVLLAIGSFITLGVK